VKDKIIIEINQEWCKGCEICVDVCPQNVFKMQDFKAMVQNLAGCTGCLLCEVLCPDFAIIIKKQRKKRKR
jgi:2-oxoglutarate ferredoxin oxidoreductase subunit delta